MSACSLSSQAVYCMLSDTIITCPKGYQIVQISKEADPEEERVGVESSGSLHALKNPLKST